MGDFLYSMIKRDDGSLVGMHSITFDGMNTWKNWHMAPKSRPFVVAPSVKEQYVDVPASDGSLDYTEVLAGKARYANRIGQWEFIIDNGTDYQEWHALYSDILMKLHGKRFKRIILEDDPEYYWIGRLTVQGQFGNKDYSSITIGYNLEPYKYPITYEGIKWWKWKELFSNTIIYGPFQVNGFKARNIINENDYEIKATINSTYRMKIFPYNGTEEMQYSMLSSHIESDKNTKYPYTEIMTGDNDYILQPGDNYMFFVGFGNITIEYERGKRL